jgi:hypothetical protein
MSVLIFCRAQAYLIMSEHTADSVTECECLYHPLAQALLTEHIADVLTMTTCK